MYINVCHKNGTNWEGFKHQKCLWMTRYDSQLILALRVVWIQKSESSGDCTLYGDVCCSDNARQSSFWITNYCLLSFNRNKGKILHEAGHEQQQSVLASFSSPGHTFLPWTPSWDIFCMCCLSNEDMIASKCNWSVSCCLQRVEQLQGISDMTSFWPIPLHISTSSWRPSL